MNNLPNALKYLKKGFSVIPCRPDKKPFLKTWLEFQERQPTEAEVKAWWGEHPAANIGIVCGKISGLTVVDCDSPDAWEALQEYLPDNLIAPVVITPSGNRQIYFKNHPELHSQNRVMPDTDLKTEGGVRHRAAFGLRLQKGWPAYRRWPSLAAGRKGRHSRNARAAFQRVAEAAGLLRRWHRKQTPKGLQYNR